MDALWTVTDAVLKGEEVEAMSVGEAFILGASFYVHDLGMAWAATPEGIEDLRKSENYRSAYERAIIVDGLTDLGADVIALQTAARELHAKKANQIVEERIPGLDRYLIADDDLRANWARFIGDVSASHHWPLPTVDKVLGTRGAVPAPNGGDLELAYVACCLRVIDYAHINAERAKYTDLVLRSNVDPTSLLHWKAQEKITGPKRNKQEKLVYGTASPIKDVDAWWLFHEMALGLDNEIRSVASYLSERVSTQNRFSLEGVAGVMTPGTFSALVQPDGFEPVDVRFKPDSIERLVQLLGGKALYGRDQHAPLRELLQNACGAVHLQRAVEAVSKQPVNPGSIRVVLENEGGAMWLRISDNGVGMTHDVITNYLLGIASDYWHSPEFFSSYPGVTDAGFSPMGRFGIGFLSVFMVGDEVTVETQRRTGQHMTLRLGGIGKRGALRKSGGPSFGTTVRVKISKQNPTLYDNVDSVVKEKAPMVDIPITIAYPDREIVIAPGWWKQVPQEDLYRFIVNWGIVDGMAEGISVNRRRMRNYYHEEPISLSDIPILKRWPGRQPEVVRADMRLLALPGDGRVLLCSRGLVVTELSVNGIMGLVEVGDIELDAARQHPLGFDFEAFREKLVQELKPKVVEALALISNEGRIPSRYEFITQLAVTYGSDVLLNSDLPWLTILQPPGHGRLVNAQEFKTAVSQAKEILISFGVGPWSADNTVYSYFPSASHESLIVPVSSSGQPRYGTYRDDGAVIGNLQSHFVAADASFERATQLICTLDLIADAWTCERNRLVESSWARNGTSNLCCHFKRSELV